MVVQDIITPTIPEINMYYYSTLAFLSILFPYLYDIYDVEWVQYSTVAQPSNLSLRPELEAQFLDYTLIKQSFTTSH